MSEVEIDNPCYAHASIRVHLHHRALVAARHDSKQAMIISRRGGRNRAFFFPGPIYYELSNARLASETKIQEIEGPHGT